MVRKRKGPTPPKGKRGTGTHSGVGKTANIEDNTRGSGGQDGTERWTALHEEAAGFYGVRLITQFTLFALPDHLVATTLRAVGNWLKANSEALSPNLCLLCPNEFSDEMPTAFVMVHGALANEPRMIVLSGLCCDCCNQDHRTLLDRSTEAIKATFWPEGVVVEPKGGEF